MVVVYTAENFKEFLKELKAPRNSLYFAQSHSDKLENLKETAAFLSNLSDRQNLETLRDQENVNLVLPVREEFAQADLKDHLSKLEKMPEGQNGSYILANHIENKETVRVTLTQSTDRWKQIDDLGTYARKMECFDDFAEVVMTVASELLTNAFYNGPKVNGEAQQTDRTQNVALDKKKPVRLSYGDDGHYLWMKVTDPFGTFSRKTLINQLLRSVGQESVEVNFGQGGAGIGLFMVFSWASQLLFQFEPNQETTVLVKLLKTKRRKTFDAERTILEIIQK